MYSTDNAMSLTAKCQFGKAGEARGEREARWCRGRLHGRAKLGIGGTLETRTREWLGNPGVLLMESIITPLCVPFLSLALPI